MTKLLTMDKLKNELDQLRSRVDTLSSLIEVSILVNSTLDLDEVINLVMEKAQTVMKAEASSVLLVNENTGVLECEVALGEYGKQVKEKITLQMGEGIAGWVAQHGEPVIVPEAHKDPRFSSKADQETGFTTRSILAVPLKVRGRVIGVAEVINPIEGNSFSDDDLDLFSTFGRQVAMAIENARMHKIMLEKQKLEQQLEAARIIQESFLPQTFPVCSTNRFQVWAKSLPATSIGGDFYDFIEFDPDTLGVVIGDVSGKGIPAALYMARLVSDFRFHTRIEKDPAQTLATINDLLVERGRRGMFVTLQYLVLDIPSGEAQVVTAGHLPILRIRKDPLRCEPIEANGGVPLGIVGGAAFDVHRFHLEHGEYLICFTDGIIEAKNRSKQQYTLERLMRNLCAEWESPEEIIENLIISVENFSRGMAQFDDLTVVALKWC